MSGWRGSWRSGLVLLLPAIAPGIAVSQAPLAPLPAQMEEVTLEDVDGYISYLRRLPWMLTEHLGDAAPDENNRRVEDDIADYVLTEPALAALTRIRDELAATTAPGATIPMSKLQPLQRQSAVEVCRTSTVMRYWNSRRMRAYHRSMIEALIERFPQAQRPQAARELQAIDALPGVRRAQLASLVQACERMGPSGTAPPMDGPDIGLDTESLAEKYDMLRIKLAAQLDAARAGEDEIWVKRPTPCPAPAPPPQTPGTRRLQILSQLNVGDFYPNEALQYRVSGLVRIRFAYDTTGCVINARVLTSTGSDALDAAGLRFAFATELIPGAVDGKPMAGMAVLPIEFKVQYMDTPPPAPQGSAQPQP